MSEQRFPAEGIERVVVELQRRDLDVSWVESDEIVLDGDGLVADTTSHQLRVSSDLFRAEIGRGAHISVGLLYVGAERGGGRARIQLPRSLAELYLRLHNGSVDLSDTRGDCEVHVDRGDLRLRRGEGSARLSLGSGELEVEDYDGSLSITGGSGDKLIRRVRGDLDVTNGSGDLELTEAEGHLSLTTGSGDVDLRDCRNERLAIQTGSGEVKLLRGVAGSISVMTGSGDIDCDVELGPDRHSFESGSGDISLGVPVGLSARIEATTTRGKIDSDVPLVEVGQRGKRSLFGKRLVGSVGEGAERAEIRLRTASGDIALRWLRQSGAEQPAPIAMGAPVAPAAPSAPSAPSPPNVTVPVTETPSEATRPAPEAQPNQAGATSHDQSHQNAAAPGDPRRQILEAVAAGTISIAEASRLLDALGLTNVGAGSAATGNGGTNDSAGY